MWIESDILAELIEPTLSALRSPSEAILAPLVASASKHVGAATAALGRNPKAVHRPSYNLGVATTLMELLGTAEQRSEMGDALSAIGKRKWAPGLLHELALIEKHAVSVKQRELAQRMSMDSGNLSRRIQELISVNLVERSRVAGTGTGASLRLTPLGHDLLDELVPGWQAKHPTTQEYFASDAAAARVSSALIDERLKEVRSARIRELPASFTFATHAHAALVRDLHADPVIVIAGGGRHRPQSSHPQRKEVLIDLLPTIPPELLQKTA